MGEPREYGPKGGTVLFLDLLAIFSPNLSEIEKNSVPALGTVLQGVPHKGERFVSHLGEVGKLRAL